MQNSNFTHYPDYDVLDAMDEWDAHTREIVSKRLGPFPEPSVLSEREMLLLKAVIKNLTFDERSEIIDWVAYHIEQTMKNEIGESQRKMGTPQLAVLIREGLNVIDQLSVKEYHCLFTELEAEHQCTLIGSFQLGTAEKPSMGSKLPQKEFFKKLASEVISAYYSHPAVWSDIGYGGPAYPRGYVRTEFGLRDPWEAKLDGK